MKTRTLLLLSLACGVAIMLAGAALLFQLATSDEPSAATPIGDEVVVGDMVVSVVGSEEAAGTLTVTVTLVGVDDPDGGAPFGLIAGGRQLRPEPPAGDDCAATSATELRRCTVRFDVAEADGVSRVLFYGRGEDQARWQLA